MKKTLILLLTFVLCIVCFCACNDENESQSSDSTLSSSYSLSENELHLSIGETATLVLNGADAASVEWRTFNASIVTVTNGIVKAISEGSINVAAIYQDEMFICRVVVEQLLPTMPVLSITNAPAKVAVDDTTIILETKFVDGIKEIQGVVYSWESDNESVLTIDSNGKITLLTAGMATVSVSCSYEGITYTAECSIEVV